MSFEPTSGYSTTRTSTVFSDGVNKQRAEVVASLNGDWVLESYSTDKSSAVVTDGVNKQRAVVTYNLNSGSGGSGGGGGTSLPDQAGNEGKFLTTDGTTVSWSDKPLVNLSIDETSITIGTKPDDSIILGHDCNVALGYGASAMFSSTAIGYDAKSIFSTQSVVIGRDATVENGDRSIAIGYGAKTTVKEAYQIGYGTNSERGTLYVGLSADDGATWQNHKLLDKNGIIPVERMIKTVELVDSSVELAANTIYNASELASLTITFPVMDILYTSQLNFTSGATATAFTAPDNIKWAGDSIVDSAFVPETNKRYVILFYYDGVNICAIIKGE